MLEYGLDQKHNVKFIAMMMLDDNLDKLYSVVYKKEFPSSILAQIGIQIVNLFISSLINL